MEIAEHMDEIVERYQARPGGNTIAVLAEDYGVSYEEMRERIACTGTHMGKTPLHFYGKPKRVNEKKPKPEQKKQAAQQDAALKMEAALADAKELEAALADAKAQQPEYPDLPLSFKLKVCREIDEACASIIRITDQIFGGEQHEV